MIIKFSNLGAIDETELDLRPLTIIIGPNNSNKTYVAYSIYGLLLHSSVYVNSNGKFNIKQETEDSYSIRMDDAFIRSYIGGYNRHTKAFKEDLETFFQDSSHRLFSNTAFQVLIEPKDVQEALKMIASGMTVIVGNNDGVEFSSKEDLLLIKLNINSERDKGDPDIRKELARLSAFFALNIILFSKPFLLPAERNAFIITYKMLANRRYKFLMEAQRELFSSTVNKQRQLEILKEQGEVRYPQPVEDFLEFLTDTELQQSTKSPASEKTVFQILADDIERYIQNHNRTSLKSTILGGREIKIDVKKGLSIDLYNASSSIKQLAPLLLYLRYRASAYDLLIIDEPEMNLHPESQAKLLEVLAILVNLDVRVLLTTHSPYFMAHLNNLVNGHIGNAQVLKKQSTLLYLKDQRAFLPLDKVSAYEMKDFKLHDLKDENYGIRWDTLSDVSAELQQKYFQIYEKGKATPHAQKKKRPRKKSTA